MADFGLDLASIADELEADVENIAKSVTRTIHSELINTVRVDTGRYLYNFVIDIGNLSLFSKTSRFGHKNNLSKRESEATRPAVAAAKSEERPKIDTFDINMHNSIYIRNYVEYGIIVDSWDHDVDKSISFAVAALERDFK